MGKGDKKTAKGKRTMGSYGVSRPKKNNTPSAMTEAPKKAKKTASPKVEKLIKEKIASDKKTVTKKAPAAKKAVTAKK